MVSGPTFGKRFFGLAWALILVAGLLGTVAPATGVVVSPGTLGGFEQDGNFVVNTAGNLDWTNVTPTKVIDDTLDSGFQGSSKEEQPANWTCNTGGADPAKGNILRAYVDPRIGSSGGTNFAYLDLGFVRQDGNGDAHVNFEFDKVPTPAASCPINRSVGDFLVTYDFPGGSSAAEIRAWRWDGTNWVELALQPSAAAAATNAAALTDPLDANSAVVARGFGEVTLNLLAAGLPTDLVGCPGFGTVNVRSRSSESIDSALQDKLPSTAVNLSDCGKLVIHKTDNHQPPQALAGAVFGLYDNSTAAGAPVLTCTTVADGTCTFDKVTPGDYWIKEISAPAGYSPDPSIRPVTIHFLETKDLTAPFVDPRDTGFVHIVKELRDDKGNVVTAPDPHLLDGASFVIYRDANGDGIFQSGETARLWPAETTPATCTISGGTGACDIGPVATGAYRVHETVAPAGTTRGADVGVTVTTGTAATPVTVTYANTLSPLNLHLVKSGPTYAHVGDTFTYTFTATTTGPRLHDISLAELAPDRCSTPLVGPAGDTNNDGFLDPGETWQWTCSHTVTVGDPDPLPNTASVTGTDDFNRTVTSTASHSVDLIHPGITVVKTGPASAHEGDVVTYSFAVTNSGDTTLTNVVVTDDKLGTIGTIPTLAAGATVTLTKTYTIPANSTAVDNTATACGSDPLSAQVCDTDHHHLTPVHPAIHVVKSGPATAHVGDTITYGFAVTNPGDTELHDVGITDARCDAAPTATGGDTNHDGVLQVAETWTYTCQHLITANDPDPLPNTVTASGTDTLGSTVTATASHSVDLIHPGITVVKTGPATAHEGDTVTYSFAVTNSGDTTLTNVVVTDDKLGTIGTIPTLAAGATVTLTKDYTIPANSTAVDNTATACGSDPLGERGCDTDHHHLTPLHPAIHVVKTGPATAHEGDVVTYSFAVTNSGDTTLTNVVVTDDKLGAIGTIPTLAAGATVTLTKDYTIPANSTAVDNTATACGADPLALKVCDTDHHHLTPIHPAIAVAKTGPATAHVGDTITYGFAVTNPGDTELHDVGITDARCDAAPTATGGDTNHDGVLQVTETWTYTCQHLITATDPDPLPNTASACGTDPLRAQVCDTDSHTVDLVHPGITVHKTGPATAHEGDTVTYSFAVTNSGDTTLTNVVVTDDKLGTIGTIPTLAAGATVTLTKTYTIPANSTAVDNTATACGADPLAAQVCDTDHHHLTPIHPAIHVVKSGPATAHVGDTITYGFAVTNPGDTELHDVGITDARCDAAPTATGGDTNHDGVLQVAETWTYTCQHLITANDPDPLPNTVTASGTDTLGSTVTATASHSVDLIHPGITVVKTGPATAHEGDVVTYSFAVTNSGDTTLTNVVVTDDKLGTIGTIPTLAAGATVTLTKDYTIPANSTAVDNTATACGVDPLGERGCDTDHHHLTPLHPAIHVVKTGPASAAVGDTITYGFAVTNVGDVDLTNVVITDDKLGAIGSLPTLAVGATTTLTKTSTVPAGQASVDNTGSACGRDPLSVEVCATSVHHLSVTQVLGETIKRTPPAEVLAVTGENATSRSLAGIAFLLGGFAVISIRRRRKG